MVQGKTKLVGQASVSGKSRPKGRAMTKRKAAPTAVHHRDRTAAAINRRNEQLMAGRLAHEGGTLAIIPKPAAVGHYDSSRAATSVKQHKQLQQSNIARHARMKREGLAVGERGKREKQQPDPTTAAGQKRKRGLAGVTKVGDEWFDEKDAELEALRYESEHSSDEDEAADNKDAEDGDEDDEKREGTDTAERQQAEDGKEADARSAAADSEATSEHRKVDDTQSTKKTKAVAVKTRSAAVLDADEAKDEDDSVRATKRAKALLGGWFAQRDSKR